MRWHRVNCEVGQVQEDAVACYEQEHGPIGENDGVILHQIVEPPRVA